MTGRGTEKGTEIETYTETRSDEEANTVEDETAGHEVPVLATVIATAMGEVVSIILCRI
jgi:hypothetical protein